MKVTVKNPSNQTIEIEIDKDTALVFSPHEVKVISAEHKAAICHPLVVVGEL